MFNRRHNRSSICAQTYVEHALTAVNAPWAVHFVSAPGENDHALLNHLFDHGGIVICNDGDLSMLGGLFNRGGIDGQPCSRCIVRLSNSLTSPCFVTNVDNEALQKLYADKLRTTCLRRTAVNGDIEEARKDLLDSKTTVWWGFFLFFFCYFLT